MYVYTHVYMCICFYSTVISEPDDRIVCERGTTTFTCLLDSSISSGDIKWYRVISDSNTTEMINPDDKHFTISTHTGNVTNSSLTITITNAINSYIEYYWVRLQSGDVCNASLTVGTSMCMYRIIDIILL